MVTILHEQFTGPAGTLLDKAKWNYRFGTWGPDKGTLRDANASLDGTGRLALTVDRDEAGTLRTARIDTCGKVEFTAPAKIAAKIQMPAGAEGTLPAFWTRGHNPAWSTGTDVGPWLKNGEIDVVEYPTNHAFEVSRSGRYLQGPSLHGPSATDPSQRVSITPPSPVLASTALSDSSYLYEMLWRTDRIAFFLNGQVVWEVHRSEFEAKGGDWTPFSGAFPHYALLSHAVNTGMTPNATADSPLPVTARVDWFKVDQL